MKVFVAGHKGMVGRHVLSVLESKGYSVVVADRATLDLTDFDAVRRYLSGSDFDTIVLAAAKVGGIEANNKYRGDFIYQNLAISTNVIHAAYLEGVTQLINLGSSCIYPKHASQPIKESALLTGPLEPTNEPYAIAKIAALKLCENYNRQYGTDYRSVMPTNLYGPGDNYSNLSSHVFAALLRRFYEAKLNGEGSVTVWGSGSPLREFMYVNDLAKAIEFLIRVPRETFFQTAGPNTSHINVGSGVEMSITGLAEMMAETVGYTGKIVFDLSKPDGTPRKIMDSSLMASLGWNESTAMSVGLSQSLNDMKAQLYE